MVAAGEAEEQHLDAANSVVRRQRLRAWCSDAWAVGDNRLHSWLRQPGSVSPEAAPAENVADGTLVALRARNAFWGVVV